MLILAEQADRPVCLTVTLRPQQTQLAKVTVNKSTLPKASGMSGMFFKDEAEVGLYKRTETFDE